MGRQPPQRPSSVGRIHEVDGMLTDEETVGKGGTIARP